MTDHDHMQRAHALLEDAMGCAIEHNLSGQVSMRAALAAIAAALRSQGEAAQVSDVTRRLIERDHRGAAKYGTTLDRTDLSLPDWLQHMAEELMDAAGYALAAKRTAEAAQAVPEGWQLVPVEVTQEMTDAVECIKQPHCFVMTSVRMADFPDRYRAMLAAAPKPEGR